ncbi:MAG: GNAT family N-acetyltransferase [Planctomycetota bacterium]
MSSWSYHPLGDNNRDQFISIVGESLNYPGTDIWLTYIERVGPENIRCVHANDTCVGGLAFYRMGQWYGGNRVASAGISGVGIDPAHRGTGVCKALLQETLRELHEEKVSLGALYASTRRLYRSVGFELSGHQIQYSLMMHSFRADPVARELPLTRITDPDPGVLAPIAEVRGRATNGNIDRTPGLWARIFEPINRSTTTYLFGEPGNYEGFATMIQGNRDAGHPQPLVAADWAANTPRALQRMMHLLLDHRSMCDRFRWNGGPQDNLLMAAQEEHLEVSNELLTLNRIIHFESALTERGYPMALQAELHFEVTDELLPGNSGKWILQVADGVGRVQRGGSGAIKLDISSLVPLYTSMHTASQLVAMGRIECSEHAMLQLADLVFGGPSPWTVELF